MGFKLVGINRWRRDSQALNQLQNLAIRLQLQTPQSNITLGNPKLKIINHGFNADETHIAQTDFENILLPAINESLESPNEFNTALINLPFLSSGPTCNANMTGINSLTMFGNGSVHFLMNLFD